MRRRSVAENGVPARAGRVRPVPRGTGAPRGAAGSCGVQDPAAGLSRQSGEAEDSLTPELRARTASSPDNDAARGNYRTARARQARPKGVTQVHQWQNPLERGTRLKPDGYGPGQAVSESPDVRGTVPTGGLMRRDGTATHCPRERRGRPAGEELGADPDKRTAVNVGTRPVSPTCPSGCRQGAASADGPGRGRSSRSSPSPGEPGTWRRGAAGLQRPPVMRGGRR